MGPIDVVIILSGAHRCVEKKHDKFFSFIGAHRCVGLLYYIYNIIILSGAHRCVEKKHDTFFSFIYNSRYKGK